MKKKKPKRLSERQKAMRAAYRALIKLGYAPLEAEALVWHKRNSRKRT